MEIKTLSNQWKKKLQTLINPCDRRLAIIGVGNVLRGDDAVGVRIVEELQKCNGHHDNVLFLNGGTSPESTTGLLRRFAPQTVLIIDAVDGECDAGTIALLNLNNSIIVPTASTHAPSLKIFASYLFSEFASDVYLLGIQPLHTALMTPLSEEVAERLNEIVDYLQSVILNYYDAP